ncbi:unnamed protein product, partial [Brassica oleracea]
LYCTKVLAKKNLSAPSDISNVWHIPEQVLANTHTNNLNLFSLSGAQTRRPSSL